MLTHKFRCTVRPTPPMSWCSSWNSPTGDRTPTALCRRLRSPVYPQPTAVLGPLTCVVHGLWPTRRMTACCVFLRHSSCQTNATRGPALPISKPFVPCRSLRAPSRLHMHTLLHTRLHTCLHTAATSALTSTNRRTRPQLFAVPSSSMWHLA